MIARDLMTGEVLSVTTDITVRQIAKILVDHGISGVPVVDSEGVPVGMVTERDLIAPVSNGDREAAREWWLTHLAEGEPLSPQFLAHLDHTERTAHEVMASPVVTVTDTTPLPEIAKLFTRYGIKRVPVIQDGRMVGIVSRADLVRHMAEEAVQSPAAPHHAGLLAEAVANLESHFTQAQTAPSPSPQAKPEEPRKPKLTADFFRGLVEDFGHQKARQREEERKAAAERRKALVKEMIDHHVEDEKWKDILRRAQLAAEAGQKELLLLRFPCELCSDGGRAINAPMPDWPETLRGEAAEIYLHWERDLKPNGFHLIAQVLDFPGGIPGDIGLTLVWGGA